MAVQVIENNNNKGGFLGTLGSLTGALGTVTGNPMLTALGTGMSAANNLFNGGGNNAGNQMQNAGALQESLKGLWDWINPASAGNIAKSKAKAILDAANKVQSNNFYGRGF